MNFTLYGIMIGTLLIALFGFLIAISFKWFWFGVKFFFKKMKYKENTGFIFRLNKGGSFNLPDIVDLSSHGLTDDEKFTPLVREGFKGTKWFGIPSLLVAQEDVKTSIGLYYQDTDADGNALYDQEGQPILCKVGLKPTTSIEPSVLKAMVVGAALSQAIMDFLKQNKMLLMVLMGVGVVSLAAAYFGWHITNDILPKMAADLVNIKGQLAAQAPQAINETAKAIVRQ